MSLNKTLHKCVTKLNKYRIVVLGRLLKENTRMTTYIVEGRTDNVRYRLETLFYENKRKIFKIPFP